MEPQCQVKIEAFEGPLDLLLHLIRKNKLEVTDIPIALVTRQYLEYLDLLQALDVVVAGEYLVMAATLMHIKSRMLLPQPVPPDAEDDPRLELVRPLQELMELRAAAEALGERPILGRDVFVHSNDLESALAEVGPDPREEYSSADRPFDVNLMDLIAAFRQAIGNRPLPTVLEIAKARVNIAEHMEMISARLTRAGRLRFFELFPAKDRGAAILTFLAILELAHLGQIRLVQEGPSGDIVLLPRSDTVRTGVREGE